MAASRDRHRHANGCASGNVPSGFRFVCAIAGKRPVRETGCPCTPASPSGFRSAARSGGNGNDLFRSDRNGGRNAIRDRHTICVRRPIPPFGAQSVFWPGGRSCRMSGKRPEPPEWLTGLFCTNLNLQEMTRKSVRPVACRGEFVRKIPFKNQTTTPPTRKCACHDACRSRALQR